MSEEGIVLAEEKQVQMEEVHNLVKRAQEIEITNQHTYDVTVLFSQALTALLDKIKETFDPLVAKTNEAHKLAVSKKKEREGPVLEAKDLVGNKIAAWHRAQEAERQAAERASRIAARKEQEEQALGDAVEAEEDGATKAEVKQILQAPRLITPPPVAPTYTPSKKVTIRTTWKGEVTDMMRLLKAIVAGKAPVGLIMGDESAINKLAGSGKGTLNVPGIRFYPVDKTITRRR